MAISRKITTTAIKELKPEDKRINDTDLSGFHARITERGKITYYLFYRHNGKQVNFKIGVHGELTSTQARDIAKVKAGEVASGIDVQEQKKIEKREAELSRFSTLEVFLDKKYRPFLESRNAKTAPKVIAEIKSTFDFLLERDLSSICAWDLEKWRNTSIKERMSATTCNYYINILKGAMSRAVEWGLIDAHELGKVKALKVSNQVVRFLSDEEERSLRTSLKKRDSKQKQERENGNVFRLKRGYEALPSLADKTYSDYLEPMVLIAMNTGMRRGELFSLQWPSVNLNQKFLTVEAGNAKSGEGRHIPLNKEAYDVLINWKQQNANTKYVFEGKKGKPLTDIKKAWSNLLKIADITNFRFHDLRHHFASKLVMKGVDLNTIRELLGHSNLDMTLRYAHLAPEHKSAAVNLIG